MVDRRTVDLYAMFSEELNMVKKEFSKQAPTLPTSQPQYAGMATWVRALKKRIDLPMKVQCMCAHTVVGNEYYMELT